jgi:hypothetical protein
MKNTHRCSVAKVWLPHTRLHDVHHSVGSWLIDAGLHEAKGKTMVGLQVVQVTMDATPLGGQKNVEAVDLRNRPCRLLL